MKVSDFGLGVRLAETPQGIAFIVDGEVRCYATRREILEAIGFGSPGGVMGPREAAAEGRTVLVPAGMVVRDGWMVPDLPGTD